MSKVSLPLRVLFVSHNGGMAGAQQTLLTLLEGLDRNLFAPHLVVPFRGELSERASKLDIPVTVRQLRHWVPCVADLPDKRRLKHLWNVLRSLRSNAWAIAALIKRFNIDLVYTNTVTCFEGALAARMSNKPHVWHIHEPINDNSELLPLLPLWLYSIVIEFFSNRVLFPSMALAQDYPALSVSASIVHNGLPAPAKIDHIAAREEMAVSIAINPSRQLVAVVGAIQPRKDHYTFLKAAKLILDTKDDVDFLIVGSGSDYYTHQLYNYVQSLGLTGRVKITGRWAGPIHTVMAAIDILVISSEQESFGLTAIESLALETPVVSTRCGGPEEIIVDGVTGFLVNRKDETAMANAVLKLLNDPTMARKIGVAGRLDVLERFTQEQYINGIQDVMLEVCGRKPHVTNHDVAGSNAI